MLDERDSQILERHRSERLAHRWASHATSPSVTLTDLEHHLFALGRFEADAVKAVRAPEPAQDLVGLRAEDALARFASGFTLILRSVHARAPWAARLASQVSEALDLEARINVYLSPAHAAGLGLHFDDHDVLVRQLHGHKHWELCPPVPLPSCRATLSELERGLLGFERDDHPTQIPDQTVIATHELGPGDFLYVPRGVPHRARSGARGSAHATLALLEPSWAQAHALAVFRSNARQPVGAAAWSGCSAPPPATAPTDEDWADVAALLELDRQRRRRPLPGRWLASVCELDALDEGSWVERRSNVRPWLGHFAGQRLFAFGEHSLPVHPPLEATFMFLAERPRFCVAELPMPPEGLEPVAFVRDLVRMGLLERVFEPTQEHP